MATRASTRATFTGADPTDHAAIATLFRGSGALDWFRWKYVSNPWVDEPTVFVSRRDGEIVTAVGFVPLVMHSPWGRQTALLLGDIAIRSPDQSPADVLDRAIGRIGRGRYPFVFAAGMPMESAPAGDAGWASGTPLPSYVRLNRASAFLGQWAERLDPLVEATTRAIAGLHRRVDSVERSLSVVPLDVASADRIPASMLASFTDGRDDGVHVARTPAFYRWRYANPHASYRTYVVYRHGMPAGAIIVEYTTIQDVSIATIAEVVTDDRTGRGPLLRSVLADRPAADVILAPGEMDRGRMERLGFLRSDQFPGTRLCHPRRVRVRGLGNRRVTDADADAWSLSFAERGIR